MNKILILTSFFILTGFNAQVNADRVSRGLFGGAANGALIGGLAGGGRGAAIGAGVGAGVGLMAGAAAEERARERRYYRYQAPPAYVEYGDEDIEYVPVRKQRYVPQSHPRSRRIIYRD
ncbi:MAG: hypothetical protein AMXMBFR12_04250 [Candidatus Babeliales bacterium]